MSSYPETTSAKLVNIKVLRELLGGVATSTVYKWLEDGMIPPPIRIGRRVFWRLSDIEAWLDSRNQESK